MNACVLWMLEPLPLCPSPLTWTNVSQTVVAQMFAVPFFLNFFSNKATSWSTWSRRHLADSIGNVFFDQVTTGRPFEACVCSFVCVWFPELKPGAFEES